MPHYTQSPQEIQGIRVVQDEVEAANALLNGETICRFEYGDSMAPVLRSGEYAKLTPIKSKDQIKRGDAVYCKIGENGYMTHMVWEISDSSFDGEKWFKIGSTGASIFGWTKDVYAIATGMDWFEESRGMFF